MFLKISSGIINLKCEKSSSKFMFGELFHINVENVELQTVKVNGWKDLKFVPLKMLKNLGWGECGMSSLWEWTTKKNFKVSSKKKS